MFERRILVTGGSGFIGSALGLGDVTGFNFGSIVLATAGAMLLLFARRKMTAG